MTADALLQRIEAKRAVGAPGASEQYLRTGLVARYTCCKSCNAYAPDT